MGVQVPPGAPTINNHMQNCYRNLNIPIEFKPWDFGYFDRNKFCEIHVEPEMVNNEIHDFFSSIGLVLLRGRYFHALPGQVYNLHVDNKFEPDRELVKLNWIYGGAGSKMIWYELKDGKSPIRYKNAIGEEIIGYNFDDCDEICRAELSGLSVVNVATIHTMQNANNYRDCYSMVIAHKDNNLRLDWNQAIDILKPYII